MRWAIKLSAFRYLVEHLPGQRNFWADMLTRWAVCPKSSINPKKVGQLKSLMMGPINPRLDPELDWPTLKDIISSQQNAQNSPPSSLRQADEGWVKEKGATWISSTDYLLKLRIVIATQMDMEATEAGKPRRQLSFRISVGPISGRTSRPSEIVLVLHCVGFRKSSSTPVK